MSTVPAGAPRPGSLSSEQATAQSLDAGAAAGALLAIERAVSDQDWSSADRLIRTAARTIDTSQHTGLYYGAPAVAYILCLAAEQHDRYRPAADTVLAHVGQIAHQRVEHTTAQWARRRPIPFRAYDLFRGLVGLGTLLLRAAPGHDALPRILRCLVEGTRPRHDPTELTPLPGWWVDHDPDRLMPTPGGHLNLGMAHGTAGILALLALATRAGITVPGQPEAIAVLTGRYDTWQQDGPAGPWWPQWLTRAEIHTGRVQQSGPGRDSWCYGAIGIARALQLAAIATDDQQARTRAEHALASCLTSTRLVTLDEPGLCHGLAGVYQTALRASAEDCTGLIHDRLPPVRRRLDAAVAETPILPDTGLLTGRLGIDLTRHQPPRTGWDTCLLIT